MKLKWCFLLNQVDLLHEFLGRFAWQAVKEGDDCFLLANSRISELSKRSLYPKQVRLYSKVDWCKKFYKPDIREPLETSWMVLFSEFGRPSYRRRVSSYKQTQEIVVQLKQFIEDVLGKERPDAVLSELPANVFTQLVFRYCQLAGIRFVGLSDSRIPGSIDVYDLIHTCSRYEQTFRELDEKDITAEERMIAGRFLTDFLSHDVIPLYEKGKYNRSLMERLLLYMRRGKAILPSWLKYFLVRSRIKVFDYESEGVLVHTMKSPLAGLVRVIRAPFQWRLFEKPNTDEFFYLFPLQVQPEASTLVLAPSYENFITTIKNVAFRLPFPAKLYVKEHPAFVGHRSASFYRELKAIPNVMLISPKSSTPELVQKCTGVIVLTSTVGMESALAGKPTYVLGNVFYSYHPLCRQVRNFDELEERLREDLSNPPSLANVQELNTRFLVSYLRNTIAGSVVAASSDNDTNDYKLIYKEIKRIFLDGKKNSI